MEAKEFMKRLDEIGEKYKIPEIAKMEFLVLAMYAICTTRPEDWQMKLL